MMYNALVREAKGLFKQTYAINVVYVEFCKS